MVRTIVITKRAEGTTFKGVYLSPDFAHCTEVVGENVIEVLEEMIEALNGADERQGALNDIDAADEAE